MSTHEQIEAIEAEIIEARDKIKLFDRWLNAEVSELGGRASKKNLDHYGTLAVNLQVLANPCLLMKATIDGARKKTLS